MDILDNIFEVLTSRPVVIGFIVVVALLVIAGIVGAIVAGVQEMNEPDHGTITQLLYHEAYTTSVPIYTSYVDSDGMMHQRYAGQQTQYHPERFEVVYELYDREKEKMRTGDCDVPESMWRELKVGDDFENINRRK